MHVTNSINRFASSQQTCIIITYETDNERIR